MKSSKLSKFAAGATIEEDMYVEARKKKTEENMMGIVARKIEIEEENRAELMPFISNSVIAFAEGDPSTTGLEHNDRIVNSEKNFVTEGFKTGMSIEVAGSSDAQNNATIGNASYPPKLIVQATEDTLLLAPSDDVNNAAIGTAISLKNSYEKLS